MLSHWLGTSPLGLEIAVASGGGLFFQSRRVIAMTAIMIARAIMRAQQENLLAEEAEAKMLRVLVVLPKILFHGRRERVEPGCAAKLGNDVKRNQTLCELGTASTKC